MLAAILKQLVQGRLPTVEYLERLHRKHVEKGTRPSFDEIYSALRDVLAHYPTVHVVVDALDECQNNDGTRSQFLSKLRELQVGRDLRVMATSRSIPEIVDGFREAPKLEVRASNEDVERFVVGQMHLLPGCVQNDHALQKTIREMIVEAVDGM